MDIPETLRSALADRYAIEREIRQGAVATVYLAEDLKHHRKVALKVVHPEVSCRVGRARFLREIGILSQLDHPGIVPLFDSGATDDAVYFVMPLVEGESLRDLLDREPRPPLDRVVHIAREVGDALAYAHAHGVIHRDVKPANVLLSSGRVLVTDFGVAHILAASDQDALTGDGLICLGTPPYVSPEEAMGAVVPDERSDVWAMGCIVYEMLAGSPPFTGVTAQVVMVRALTDAPEPLGVTCADLGPAVEAVVEKALEKDPKERWRSATAFVEALEKAAVAPNSAEYVPTRLRLRRQRRRLIGATVATVAAAVVLAVLTCPAIPGPGGVGVGSPSSEGTESQPTDSHNGVAPSGGPSGSTLAHSRG